MSKKNIREKIKYQKIVMASKKNDDAKWETIKNSKLSEWESYRQKRHKNILRFDEFKNMNDDVEIAEEQAQKRIKSIIDLPQAQINELNHRYLMDDLNYAIFNSKDKEIALRNAQDSIVMAQQVSRMNSMQTFNNQISSNISNSYSGNIIDPYEAQSLFETTSLGYQGVMIPIKDAFSTTLSIVSKFITSQDVENITRYLVEKNIVDFIKMAVIDANVYGGGILTPVFNIKNEPLYLSALSGDILKYFGVDNMKLDTLMCFDRYCVIPNISNDGMYHLKLWTSLPMDLTTIFDDGVLDGNWYSKFSLDTTSRCKFIRPDGFGVSIFARANKAVYNYEQQIQFLNYALGQLSIIVFNSKSQDYMNGGSADHTWNSALSGSELNDIRSQLSNMQHSMNNQRGLFLNDIEVTALNRTFTGVDSIINAMNSQASMAFGIRRDILFGEVKSSLGYKEDSKTTPQMEQLRESFRTSIMRVLKWCVMGYFAERGWKKIGEHGEIISWDKKEFKCMLDSIDVLYSDSIKTNESILKESGVNEILKLLDGRVMRISDAVSYLTSIPILNKAYGTETDDYKAWRDSLTELQEAGIKAETIEQKSITAINEAILDKKDPLSPPQSTNIDKNEKLVYDSNNASKKPLEDFGQLDENGIVQPRSVEKRKTLKEVTQKYAQRRQHT